MSKHILKAMYQEKPKRLIIWNGGSYRGSDFSAIKKTHQAINSFAQNTTNLLSGCMSPQREDRTWLLNKLQCPRILRLMNKLEMELLQKLYS